jgi:hypothetical protein
VLHHPYPVDSGPRGRDSNSTAFRTSSCWRTAGRDGIIGPGEARLGRRASPSIPCRFRPTRPGLQLHGIQNVVMLAYRRKRRNRRPGRSKAQSTCRTIHTPSIPAHAAGTPRHSERRHVGVPPEEAESSARHEARFGRRASPSIPCRFRPTRPGLQLHGIQHVVMLAYRRKRRNRRPGRSKVRTTCRTIHSPSIPAHAAGTPTPPSFSDVVSQRHPLCKNSPRKLSRSSPQRAAEAAFIAPRPGVE